MELLASCGYEHFGDENPCPMSIDSIIKSYYEVEDEGEKDAIVILLSKDVFGVVRSGDQIVLCREDYLECTLKVKSIRGTLNNVNIEHEKICRIMQDGGSALDDGDIKRAFAALNNHYASKTATNRITLMPYAQTPPYIYISTICAHLERATQYTLPSAKITMPPCSSI